MKRSVGVFILFLLVVALSTAQAQYQSIFGANQTSWKYAYFGCLGCSSIDSASVVYGMDTVIQGMNFKRVSKIGSSPFPGDFYLSEDVLNGKGYYYNPSYSRSQVVKIFDLTMQVGDTLMAVGFVVDSVYVKNGLRHLRTDYVANGVTFSMIEGVGTTFGVDYAAFGTAEGLLCQVKDSLTNYTGFHPTLDCQSSMLSTDLEEVGLQNELSVQPNPASDFVILKSGELPIIEVEFIDMKGSVIKRVQNPHRKIAINELKNGVYFIKMYHDRGVSSNKLIVSR